MKYRSIPILVIALLSLSACVGAPMSTESLDNLSVQELHRELMWTNNVGEGYAKWKGKGFGNSTSKYTQK